MSHNLPVTSEWTRVIRIGMEKLGLGAKIQFKGSVEHLFWRPRDDEIFQAIHLH